jgi:hypothetical protein
MRIRLRTHARLTGSEPVADAATGRRWGTAPSSALLHQGRAVGLLGEGAGPERCQRRKRERVLDEPIPALDGKSPRAAAKTPKGREKVAAWLKMLENHMARQDPGSPMASYDVGWMWRELGVEALRR